MWYYLADGRMLTGPYPPTSSERRASGKSKRPTSDLRRRTIADRLQPIASDRTPIVDRRSARADRRPPTADCRSPSGISESRNFGLSESRISVSGQQSTRARFSLLERIPELGESDLGLSDIGSRFAVNGQRLLVSLLERIYLVLRCSISPA